MKQTDKYAKQHGYDAQPTSSKYDDDYKHKPSKEDIIKVEKDR